MIKKHMYLLLFLCITVQEKRLLADNYRPLYPWEQRLLDSFYRKFPRRVGATPEDERGVFEMAVREFPDRVATGAKKVKAEAGRVVQEYAPKIKKGAALAGEEIVSGAQRAGKVVVSAGKAAGGAVRAKAEEVGPKVKSGVRAAGREFAAGAGKVGKVVVSGGKAVGRAVGRRFSARKSGEPEEPGVEMQLFELPAPERLPEPLSQSSSSSSLTFYGPPTKEQAFQRGIREALQELPSKIKPEPQRPVAGRPASPQKPVLGGLGQAAVERWKKFREPKGLDYGLMDRCSSQYQSSYSKVLESEIGKKWNNLYEENVSAIENKLLLEAIFYTGLGLVALHLDQREYANCLLKGVKDRWRSWLRSISDPAKYYHRLYQRLNYMFMPLFELKINSSIMERFVEIIKRPVGIRAILENADDTVKQEINSLLKAIAFFANLSVKSEPIPISSSSFRSGSEELGEQRRLVGQKSMSSTNTEPKRPYKEQSENRPFGVRGREVKLEDVPLPRSESGASFELSEPQELVAGRSAQPQAKPVWRQLRAAAAERWKKLRKKGPTPQEIVAESAMQDDWESHLRAEFQLINGAYVSLYELLQRSNKPLSNAVDTTQQALVALYEGQIEYARTLFAAALPLWSKVSGAFRPIMAFVIALETQGEKVDVESLYILLDTVKRDLKKEKKLISFVFIIDFWKNLVQLIKEDEQRISGREISDATKEKMGMSVLDPQGDLARQIEKRKEVVHELPPAPRAAQYLPYPGSTPGASSSSSSLRSEGGSEEESRLDVPESGPWGPHGYSNNPENWPAEKLDEPKGGPWSSSSSSSAVVSPVQVPVVHALPAPGPAPQYRKVVVLGSSPEETSVSVFRPISHQSPPVFRTTAAISSEHTVKLPLLRGS